MARRSSATTLPTDEVALGGALALSNGKLILGVLGQELSDLHGRLVLHDDTIRIEELKVRDFDGQLGIGGTFTFAGLRELNSELSLRHGRLSDPPRERPGVAPDRRRSSCARPARSSARAPS